MSELLGFLYSKNLFVFVISLMSFVSFCSFFPPCHSCLSSSLHTLILHLLPSRGFPLSFLSLLLPPYSYSTPTPFKGFPLVILVSPLPSILLFYTYSLQGVSPCHSCLSSSLHTLILHLLPSRGFPLSFLSLLFPPYSYSTPTPFKGALIIASWPTSLLAIKFIREKKNLRMGQKVLAYRISDVQLNST